MRVTFTLLLSVDFQKGSSFLVYKNSPVREDSEIDFPTGNVLCVCVCVRGGGGGGYTRTFLKFYQQSILQEEKLPEKPGQ